MIKKFLRKYWGNLSIVLIVSLLWMVVPQIGIGQAGSQQVVYVEREAPQVINTQIAGNITAFEKVDPTTLKADLLKEPKYALKEEVDWEANIQYRGIDHKSTDRLVELIDFYPEKINRLIDIIATTIMSPDDITQIGEKIARLKDKYISVDKELQLRKDGKVDREIHSTWYYVDLVAGNNTNTGLTTAQSWLTIQQYTTTTVRTSGDVGWVRAGTSQVVVADVAFDEDGSSTNFIEIRGCSVVDDPWGDSSDIKPIFDFNGGANNFYINGDYYWRFYRLDLTNTTDGLGVLYCISNIHTIIDSLDIHDNSQTGMRTGSDTVEILNSNFWSNGTYNIQQRTASFLYVSNSTFEGGAGTTDYGIYSYGGRVLIEDSTFGATTPHDQASILLRGDAGEVNTRNVLFADATEVNFFSDNSAWAAVFSEDHDQIQGNHKNFRWNGIVTSSSAITRPGGASSSALMEPDSDTGTFNPLTPSRDVLFGDFKVYVTSGSATTVHIYMRDFGGWAVYPNSTTLYIQAVFYNGTAGYRERSTPSESVLYDAATWIDFNTTFTPQANGFVYVYVYLKRYEAGKGVYVDIKPTTS